MQNTTRTILLVDLERGTDFYFNGDLYTALAVDMPGEGVAYVWASGTEGHVTMEMDPTDSVQVPVYGV